MMLRSGLLSACVFLAAFAGCLGGADDHDHDAHDHGSESPDPGGNLTGVPPTANFVVFFNGTALAAENGTIVVGVNSTLQFDASNSSDPDGTNLTYAWDLGDGTMSEAAVVNHTYANVANYTVSVTVTDEQNFSAVASLEVSVIALAPEPPAGPPVYFLDDAEGSIAWTTVKHILLTAIHGPETQTVTQNHPRSAGWHKATKDKAGGAKSWTMQDEAAGMYHDHEYTHMTSPKIDLTGAPSAQLTFKYKGDSESNNFDGIEWMVSTDGTSFTRLPSGFKSGKVADWTEVTVDLKAYLGKQINLRFLFKSDSTCGQETSAFAGTAICGAGAFTGYFVDDIKVAGKA